MKALKKDARFQEFANDLAWLTDANAALETVCYLPLYMLPFIAEEAQVTRLSTQREEDVNWDSLLLQ